VCHEVLDDLSLCLLEWDAMYAANLLQILHEEIVIPVY